MPAPVDVGVAVVVTNGDRRSLSLSLKEYTKKDPGLQEANTRTSLTKVPPEGSKTADVSLGNTRIVRVSMSEEARKNATGSLLIVTTLRV
jgi:hypothetical protein